MNDRKGLVVIKIISIISIVITIVYTLTGFVSGNCEDLLISKIQSIVKAEDDAADEELDKEVKNVTLADEEEDTEYQDEEDIEHVEEDVEDDVDIEEEEECTNTEEDEEITEEPVNNNEDTEDIEENTVEVSNVTVDNENKNTIVDSKVENPTEVNVEQVTYPRIVKNSDGTIALLRSQQEQPIAIVLDEYVNGFLEFNYNYCVITAPEVEYSIEFECNGNVEVAVGTGSTNVYRRYVNRKVKNNDKLNIKLTAKINGTEESTSFQRTINRGIFGFR
ncbi:Hypothetical protein CM240_0217 [Clostridium bornimense]|uniref:Uncharacterized protein n=1 Tax=Clostridium bornimense TaxID=1216932 RepID=W6RZG1_9CLOT|nr:hypothetical protein [Clostridium bornimense]CDM67387.1 Hypothetical protein CM240_0217 [Clostridium bornimense]